jgi:uncharacterized protein
MYGRPGVYVEENLLSSPPSVDPSVATAIFVAAHGRGPTEPTTVRSWADFTRIYGGFPSLTSMLPYSLFNYFNNGGTNAIVLRVPGAGATAASRTLLDRDSTEAAATLEVEAKNVGAWGNDIVVEVRDAGAEAFSLIVRYRGTVVERFEDLSMDPSSQRYVDTVVNSARGGSVYITVTDLFSVNSDEGANYAVVRPQVEDPSDPSELALAGGSAGDTPTTEALTNSIDQLSGVARHFLLNFPGETDEGLINAAITFCESQGEGFVVAETPPGSTVSESVSYGEGLQNSSYAAVYYPWIHVNDPASPGSTKLVPPGGAVAGLIAATDTTRGVWKAPAGIGTRVAGAVALERAFSNADLDTLNRSHVNVIRHIPNAGLCVMGARTLKRSGADKYLPIRRTMIYLRTALIDQTRWAVFEPNDAVLWAGLEANISQFLTGFWQSGGLKGNSVSEAFFVRSDASINTTDVVAAGEVRVQVGVALRYPAEFIVITLSQWEGGAAVNEVEIASGPNL